MMGKKTPGAKRQAPGKAIVEPRNKYVCLRCPQAEGMAYETDDVKFFFDHLEAEHPGLVTKDEEGMRKVAGAKCLDTMHLDGSSFYQWVETFGDSEGRPFLARSITRPRRKSDPMNNYGRKR